MDKLKIGIATTGLTIVGLLTPVLAHAQAVTVDPTDLANVNAAVGSIPNTAKAEVFAIFPVVMPYILIVVSIGIAFALLSFFMSKAKHH